MPSLWKCINCDKSHSTIRIFKVLKGNFYSVDFCSDKCLQKYHKSHDIGLLETHPKEEGYPIYENIGNKKSLVGHMEAIIMWVRPKMKIILTLNKEANLISRLRKYEQYTRINEVNAPIYMYEVKE